MNDDKLHSTLGRIAIQLRILSIILFAIIVGGATLCGIGILVNQQKAAEKRQSLEKKIIDIEKKLK